jgi:beta-N-acetylhexosaminidase
MGTRTAAPDASRVIEYSRAFLSGLAAHGVTGCAKHFPGLGGGTLDSHQLTPSIARTWPELWNEDLVPYRELSSELAIIMVNHAAYPLTRGGDTPATASPFWITKILHKRLGYRGLIFSDDMEMGGILNYMPIEEAAIAALRAGIHLMEICHSPELILRCYESLLREAERSAAFRSLLLGRAAIGARLRRVRFSAPPTRAISATRLAALADQIRRFTAVVESAQ